MIFHCTKKLSAKLSVVSATGLPETSPLGSWHAHVHTIDRRQCVMFCHDASRYVLFQAGLRKAQFAALGKLHKELFLEALSAQGVTEPTLKRVELAMGPAQFDSVTDRSVQSSLNQARFDFDAYLDGCSNIMEVDLLDAARWLNHRPTKARSVWLHPDKCILELVERLTIT
jgi:hypothetical protein